MSGGLVAQEQSSLTWHTTLGPVDSFVMGAEAAGRGDWVEAGIGAAAGGLETLGAIADPLGALFSAGIGFVMEKWGPLKEFLDGLAGSPDQISAFAQTWYNVAGRIHDNADDFRAAVSKGTADWEGPAVAAYKAFAEMQAGVIDAFGKMCTGVAGCTEVAGALVGAVRNMVRDAISETVGYAISKALQILTVALAPKAIAEVVAKISEWAAKMGAFIKNLVKSMGKLGEILSKIADGAKDTGTKVREIAKVVDEWPVMQDFSVQKLVLESSKTIPGVNNPGSPAPV